MNLTKEINQALARMQSEDHVVQNGLRDVLFDSVGTLFDEPDKKFFPLRPSGCVKPMRDLYYDLVNYYNPGRIPKKDFEPRIKLIFQFGHLTETLIKDIFKSQFEVVHEQENVKYGELTDNEGNTIELRGAIDWAVKLDSCSEKLTLCDSKSIGDFPFKKAPKEDNIAQMQLYMHSEWGRANKVDSALLIYFNKNTSDIKCIEVAYDERLAANILHRLEQVYEYYKNDQVPPREYLAGLDWQADYSAYKDYDNREFTTIPPDRENVVVGEYYNPPSKYEKDNLRAHVEKYGANVVNYVDKKVFVLYDNGKLTLVQQDNY